MSLASLVAPNNHRTSWFGAQGAGTNKHKPLTDFRIRRASIQSKAGGKPQDPVKGKDSVDSSADSASLTGYGEYTSTTQRCDFCSTRNLSDADVVPENTASSFISKQDNSRPSSISRSLPSPLPKKRGSLLVAASDVLGFRFGRRRKSVRQPPMPIMLPDVIEITAPRHDDEVEERERLRDAAAQSIGLDPILMSTEVGVKGAEEEREASINDHHDQEDLGGARTFDNIPTDGRYPDSSMSETMKIQTITGSLRKSSLQAYKPSRSANIPDFPSTISTLADVIQGSSGLAKYYPPTSLRFFTLSRSWKSRFLVLSSSPSSGSSQGPTSSYLHLFRSSGVEEKELERLEINEESVVFVAEEDVGGRKNVVKVGGVDVSIPKEPNYTEGGRTMWFLQILDPPEAQKWITLIKSIILGQRY